MNSASQWKLKKKTKFFKVFRKPIYKIMTKVVVSRNYAYIIVGILIISIAFNFYQFWIDDEDYVQDYQNKITELQKKVDSLATKNVGLKYEIVQLGLVSDSLDREIDIVEQKRVDIIRSYEYYLKDVLDLDDTELELWFSTRYPVDSTRTESSTISSY